MASIDRYHRECEQEGTRSRSGMVRLRATNRRGPDGEFMVEVMVSKALLDPMIPAIMHFKIDHDESSIIPRESDFADEIERRLM